MPHIHIVLLSGGSGTRLWPLSTNTRPKQFLKVLRDTDGQHVSMVQRVFNQIRHVAADLDITVATSSVHQEYLKAQLCGSYKTVLEPERRDTAPAIMLACANLAFEQQADPNDTVVVMPIDTYADQSYYDRIPSLDKAVQKSKAELVLLAVKPTYPSEKYGYILPSVQTKLPWPVKEFKEKPNETAALDIIEQGGLWNCGVFAFRLSYISSLTERYYHPSSFEDLREHYSALPKTSFDYEVVEKASRVAALPYEGAWKDLGTWNTLTDEMAERCAGRVSMDEKSCKNVHVINETSMPLVVAGISDTAVVATPDGILVTGKDESAHIKGLIEKARLTRPMYEKRPWGEYRVLSAHSAPDGREILTQEVVIAAAKEPSRLEHEGCSEVWTVISGAGALELNGREKSLASGDVLRISADSSLTVCAHEELHIIEVRIPEGINPFLDVQSQWRRWQDRARCCSSELADLTHDENELADSFCRDVSFGTGGIRAKMGAGPNRLNVYTVARATQGLADWLHASYPLAQKDELAVAVGRDTRRNSDVFARTCAEVLAGNGIAVHIFQEPTPTPALSFALRALGCVAGVVITASHNRANYNGYKVYGKDGCQITTEDARAIQASINATDIFDGVHHKDFDAELAAGHIFWISPDVGRAYRRAVLAQAIKVDSAAKQALSVIYTPLNGTGASFVPEVLRQDGFSKLRVVLKQTEADPDFTSCPYPNPESGETLSCGLELAKHEDADLLIATDPDCDRMGVAVRHATDWKQLSGNDVGVLLLDWLCRYEKACGHTIASRVVLTTIVTTPMIDALANYYGFELRRTLTGFKFIGEQIGLLEKEGQTDRFLFGLEESIGYLKGSYVRDKDGVVASLLICELAAELKEEGHDLIERLEGLRDKFGHFISKQITIPYQGIDGPAKMRAVLSCLRKLHPKEIGGLPITATTDYIHRANMPTLNASDKEAFQRLPASNVLQWDLKDHSRLIIRPSGTEPKLKAYLFAYGKTDKEAKDTLSLMESGLDNLLHTCFSRKDLL